MPSRRQAFKAAAAAAGAFPILGQQHQHAAAPAAAAAKAYKPKWATPAEMQLIAEWADLLIPRTETPGSSDAKVHEYIDFTLARDPKRKALLRQALEWFSQQPAKQAALTAASNNLQSTEGRYFTLLKDLTIDGYYQSREGLITELGWHGNTSLPKFDGCTHPEHKG